MRGIIMRTWLAIYGIGASVGLVASAYLRLIFYTVISQRRLPFNRLNRALPPEKTIDGPLS